MTKVSVDDVMVIGNRVLVKRYGNHGHYIWVCVAEFYGQPNTVLGSINSDNMAKQFAETLTGYNEPYCAGE